MNQERQSELLLTVAREDADVLAVILFGSRARGEASPKSDRVLLVRDEEEPYKDKSLNAPTRV